MSKHAATAGWLALVWLYCAGSVEAADNEAKGHFLAKVEPFVKQHCVRCHGAEKQSAKLRFDGGYPNLADETIRKNWELAWVKIASGEMPPKGEPAPDTAAMVPVLDLIRAHAATAELAARGAVSGNGLRRLTSREQVRKWTDLLQLHYANHTPDFLRFLAQDPHGEDFINRGDVLLTQQEHVTRLLDLAERMTALVVPDPVAEKPITWNIKPDWIASHEIQQKFYQVNGGAGRPAHLMRTADGMEPSDPKSQLEVHAGCWPHHDGSGMVLNPVYRTRGGLNGFDHIILRYPAPTTTGIVRLVIRARAELPKGETALPELWLDSFLNPGSQLKLEGSGSGKLSYHTVWSLARITVPTTTTDLVIEVPLELTAIDFASLNSGSDKGLWLMLRNLPVPNIMPFLLTREEKNKLQQAGKYRPDSERPPKGTPGWAYYPNDIQDGPKVVIEKISLTVHDREPESDNRRTRVIGKATLGDLKAFAERAWSRPVSDAEIKPYHDLLEAKRKALGEPAAIRLAMTAVMAAPDGIYLPDRRAEKAHGAHDRARRLAVTLWGLPPDRRLLDLAGNGTLLDATVLRKEIARMTADERFGWFTEEFSRQWLGLDEMQEISGSWTRNEFTIAGGYPRNTAIHQAMMAEPGQFLLDAFRRNRPVGHLIAPDQLMLTGPLAEFYGVKADIPHGWQPVKELPEHRRQGILTMSGPMIVASREEKESQIYRGAYLLTRVLGVEVGTPPANVPTIQSLNENPGFRGKSIREKLSIHLERTCAVCHTKIDPLGFAWEHFDPYGRLFINAQGQLRQADTSGMLPNGKKFRDLASMSKVMLEDPKTRGSFPRAFTKALTSYVLGRKLTLSDESRIDALLGDDGNPNLADLLARIMIDDYSRK
ncbi:MAG: DUF1592 domain-containing protein [Planctomycetia bacterium]|nr:DUF1592 domain-containing protein [Planctomycetia bacterium]